MLKTTREGGLVLLVDGWGTERTEGTGELAAAVGRSREAHA